MRTLILFKLLSRRAPLHISGSSGLRQISWLPSERGSRGGSLFPHWNQLCKRQSWSADMQNLRQMLRDRSKLKREFAEPQAAISALYFHVERIPMKWIRLVYRNKRRKILLLLAGLLLSTHPVVAKLAVDFNPNLDFSKFKTFAFIGGVEQLVRMQLNPDQLNNQIHRAVTRELTAKGLREVKPDESPDLVVRYWVNSEKDFNVAANTN